MRWLPLCLLLSSCAAPRAIVTRPSESMAPDGCVWVARQDGTTWHRALYLCCAQNQGPPVCQEAEWE